MGLFDQPGFLRIRSRGVEADVPLAPALVLFGPNDAGKTNLLRAIADLAEGIPRDRAVRRDWFREQLSPPDSEFPGDSLLHRREFDRVSFEIDLSTETGRGLLGWLVNPDHPFHYRFFQSSSGGGLPLVAAERPRSTDIIKRIEAASAELRKQMVVAPGDMAAALYESLVSGVADAIDKAVDLPGERDVFHFLFRDCVVELGACVAGLYMRLPNTESDQEAPTDDSSLSLVATLPDDAVTRLVDVSTSQSFEESSRVVAGGLVDHILAAAGWERADWGDEWFTPNGDESQRKDPWFDGDLRVPSDSVVAVCRELSERATDIAPEFVQAAYRIEVQPLEPSWWYLNAGERLRIALVPSEERWSGWHGEPPGFSLDAVGAGLRVWSAFAVTEAMRQLTRRNDRREAVYLFDEPERHLHPVAQRQAAEFISAIVAEGAGAIVATHSPAFLNVPIPGAQYVRLERLAGSTKAFPLDGGLKAVETNAGRLGLSAADLLQLTRGILLVEGPVDRIVLDAFYGRPLSDAYVRALPLWGARNALALVDADLLRRLGIPVFVMLDETSEQFVEGIVEGRVRTKPTGEGERALFTLALALREEKFNATFLPFPLPDIVWTLPDVAVRAVVPSFPGWKSVGSALHARRKGEGLDVFLQERYGLSKDIRTVKKILRIARDRGLEPATPDLYAAVSRVIDVIGARRAAPSLTS